MWRHKSLRGSMDPFITLDLAAVHDGLGHRIEWVAPVRHRKIYSTLRDPRPSTGGTTELRLRRMRPPSPTRHPVRTSPRYSAASVKITTCEVPFGCRIAKGAPIGHANTGQAGAVGGWAKAGVPADDVSISQGRSTMKHVIRMALIVGVAGGALWAVSSDRGYTQAADPNTAPNPYKMQDNWLQLPEGRKLGAAIKVQVDHSDGKSMWVFDRCAGNSCDKST